VTKLSVKYGEIVIDFDGPEDFLKSELRTIVSAVRDLSGIAAPPAITGTAKPRLGATVPVDSANASVSTIAQKLGVKNGTELIASAALSLALGGMPSFKKKALRDRTREAKTFWKKSYGNNFDNYVGRLVTAGRLNHVGGDDYAIPDSEQQALSTKLAPK